jgi:hypothetical protein
LPHWLQRAEEDGTIILGELDQTHLRGQAAEPDALAGALTARVDQDDGTATSSFNVMVGFWTTSTS